MNTLSDIYRIYVAYVIHIRLDLFMIYNNNSSTEKHIILSYSDIQYLK